MCFIILIVVQFCGFVVGFCFVCVLFYMCADGFVCKIERGVIFCIFLVCLFTMSIAIINIPSLAVIKLT